MKFRLGVGFVFVLSLCLISISHAQIPSLGDYGATISDLGDYSGTDYGTEIGPDLNLATAPLYPQPHKTVRVYINDSSAQYNSSPISWYQDGKKILEGVGKTSVNITAGANGSQTSVSAIVTLDNGSTLTKNLTIRPTGVDLLWQAESYTPAFYKGKALVPYQGKVKIVAMPSLISGGSELAADTLTYTWKLNGRVLGSLSGYGRSTLELTADVINPVMNVEVVVTNKSKSVTGGTSITINPQSPAIVMYEDSPLYGTLYNQTLSDKVSLKGQEVSINAAPYYFSTATSHGLPASYLVWSINGKESVVSNTLTLRKPSNTTGSTLVSVGSKGEAALMQGSTAQVLITYTK